jgi:hypothetical protein
MNNKLITQVYRRRRYKTNRNERQTTNTCPVFDALASDHESVHGKFNLSGLKISGLSSKDF